MSHFLYLLFLLEYSAVESYDVNLTFVAIVFRNGERTPFKGQGIQFLNARESGILTDEGRINSYELGAWLVEQYQVLFANRKLNPSDIYIRSSDTDRAILTAKAMLSGMFNYNSKIFNKSLLRKYLKIHTTARNQDNILSDEMSCPTYDLEMSKLKKSRDYTRTLQNYTNFMLFLSECLSKPINDFETIKNIYNTLYIENLMGYGFPCCAEDKILSNNLSTPTSYSYRIPTLNRKLARFSVGPLLKDIIDEMKNIAFSLSSRKIAIYSGHGETVANILNGLNLLYNHIPKFLATILLEMFYDNNTKSYNIRILYKEDLLSKPEVLYIPKCGSTCPLNKFIYLNKPILPYNWRLECEPTFEIYNSVHFWLIALINLLSSVIFLDVIDLVVRELDINEIKYKITSYSMIV